MMHAPTPTPLARLAMSRVGNYVIVARNRSQGDHALRALASAVERDGGVVTTYRRGQALLDNGSTVDLLTAGTEVLRGRTLDGAWLYNLSEPPTLEPLVLEVERSLRPLLDGSSPSFWLEDEAT